MADRVEQVLELAKAKTRTPGTLMLLVGVIMLVGWIGNVAMLATGYDATVKLYEIMVDASEPGSPQRKRMEKLLEEAKTRDKSLENVIATITTVVSLVFNALVVVAGQRMKNLQSYGLCIAGCAAAIVPINSCCCLGFPVGIWALITLINAQVKEGFALTAAQSQANNLDQGWSDINDQLDRE